MPVRKNMDTQKLILKDNFDGKINEEIWTLRRINSDAWIFVSDPLENEKACLMVTVQKNDKQEIGRDGQFTERSELREKQEVLVTLGNSVWYRFLFFLPEDFVIVDNRLSFAQWKQYYKEEKQSPFLSFHYRNGKLIVKILGKSTEEKFKTNDELRGKWHDVLINYELNSGLTGFVKIWLNGALFVDYNGQMGFEYTEPLTYFKMGLYRDQLEIPQIIYFKYFRRGPTKESVSV